MKITIKAHTRKTKTGKVVTIRSYERKVGGKLMSRKGAGEELVRTKASAPVGTPKVETPKKFRFNKSEYDAYMDYLADSSNISQEDFRPPKTYSEAKAYEAYARRRNSQNRIRVRSDEDTPKKKSNWASRIEDKVARFVEKYSGQKYRRKL